MARQSDKSRIHNLSKQRFKAYHHGSDPLKTDAQMLLDAAARQSAIDIKKSFIVQAPAGSGKTEILSQRFLHLLSVVEAPEEIIALTFTKKAAAEMRARILDHLESSALGIQPESPHQEATLHYAQKALLQDSRKGWNLLKQHHRLRIMTIDALCQLLSQAIPIFEKELPFAQISDKSQMLYQKAAKTCILDAAKDESYQDALKTILKHLDNRQDQLLTLFCQILSERDKWLHLIYHGKEQSQINYEMALAYLIQHELDRFKKALGPIHEQELFKLCQILAVWQDPDISCLCPSFVDAQSVDALDQMMSKNLAKLLLTSQNVLRQSLDHHSGLKRKYCPPDIYQGLKKDSKALFEALRLKPEILSALRRLRNLPKPHYQAEQWQVLQALFKLLPLLVAELQLCFQEEQKIDFIAMTQQAQLALGDEENPTSLALYLDHQIHHLLIDEFQDTSIEQFHLLSQLVKEWNPDDGKTLFIVGDPMQSIYRFRAAEVGLFLRAKIDGLGGFKLKSLNLSCNFRSTARIVSWINASFEEIFPKLDDIESGAIRFNASVATKTNDEASFIRALAYESPEAEAEALVTFIKEELARHPEDKIAILIRQRSQLKVIIQSLKQANIPFQGVDIDLLAQIPHIGDLWSLTQALLRPGNRLAWLALLHSPYCGLNLNDLHALATHNKEKSIFEALSQLEKINTISPSGKIRANYFYQVMQEAFSKRHQRNLVAWIKDVLKNLHIDKILNHSQKADLEQYWVLLESYAKNEIIEDFHLFEKELAKLYSQEVIPSRLEIMTIHKSKGLEFDCVILPGLGSKSRPSQKNLLRWLKIPTKHQNELILISPIKANTQESDALYDFLGDLDAEKSSYENQRLAYVAVTRAKKRLYLSDHHVLATSSSLRDLFKNENFETIEQKIIHSKEKTKAPSLWQIPLPDYEQIKTKNLILSKPKLLTQKSDSENRYVGIATHILLQWICTYHPRSFNEIPWHIARYQLKNHMNEESLIFAIKKIKASIKRLYSDAIGLWIIQKHESEANEYAILSKEKNQGTIKIIDRCFIEKNRFWIIDFKTGEDNRQTNQDNLKQVNKYAKIFHKAKQPNIECGLYYLKTNQWIQWTYQQEETEQD